MDCNNLSGNICSYACFLLVLFTALALSSSNCYQFPVGGPDGWLIRPTESYTHWAERLRFQVNDTLLFKYNKDSDSVLVVTENDYNQCNTANPLLKLSDGSSIFKLDRSGPFFFITGNKSNCAQGQKLIIVVLAVRSPPRSPPSGGVAPPADAPGPRPDGRPAGGGGSGRSDHPANGGVGTPPHRSFAAPPARSPWLVLVWIVSAVSLGFGGVSTVFSTL